MNSREFAIHVVEELQQAGFQALWAGGCVRDQLLGLKPKDYDVATIATPEQVREVFGRKRTLSIGASFGVITVLGPQTADPIEVATFRRDGGYSDGRRPDSVEFTDAREDAQRRDFTINGMFYDPIEDTVLDFVGGKEDLVAKQIRAIGDPGRRIEEDKLRMLRGVRFASKYGFSIEDNTLAAIQDRAEDLAVVSHERIGAEMIRMLTDSNRSTAAELLRRSKLFPVVTLDDGELTADEGRWSLTLDRLGRLADDFSAAVVVLLDPVLNRLGVQAVADHWKLSNQQKKSIEFVMKNKGKLAEALDRPWSEIQPLLLSPFVDSAIAVLDAMSSPQAKASAAFLREKLALDPTELDPLPLLSGQDLIAQGVEPGPAFKKILDACRAKQLDGEIMTKADALQFVRGEMI